MISCCVSHSWDYLLQYWNYDTFPHWCFISNIGLPAQFRSQSRDYDLQAWDYII